MESENTDKPEVQQNDGDEKKDDQSEVQPDNLPSQSEYTTRTGREVKLTEKMTAYKHDEAEKREKKLISSYETWKIKIRDIRKTLKDECNETDLADMADTIQFTENSVIRQFENLRKTGIVKPEIVRKIDALVAINADIMKIVNERISGIDTFDPTSDAELLRSIKTRDYATSIFSAVSTGTGSSERSFNSTRSKISDKVIDASAELAAREAELELLKTEQRHKEKLLELEMSQKRELEAHHRELKELEIRKHVEVAKARLNVYKKADDMIDEENLETVVKREPLSLTKDLEHVETKVTNKLRNDTSPHVLSSGIQKDKSKTVSNVESSVIHNRKETVIDDKRETDYLAKAFVESVHLNRLLVPEPSIFTGDPLKYIEWKTSFEMLIDRKGIPSSEKIFYLKRYLGGEAQKALEGFFYSNSTSAYDNARKVLDDRYGHPFIMQRAFREKLDKWPKIGSKDPQGLRNFSDFLQGCKDAMVFVPSLSVLNDCIENQKLLAKLPEWATMRWNREVNNALETTSEYPSFSTFVNFVAKEAKIACNPVSSLYAINDKEQRGHKDKSVNSSKVRTLTTISNDKNNNVQSNVTSTGYNIDSKAKTCDFCKNNGHFIFKCDKFLDLSIDKKREFIRNNNLCYGCLRTGHLNKDCKRKHTCGTCGGKHPTCLHENRNPNVTEAKPVRCGSSHLSQDRGQGTSMIVPVWVSHKDKPSKEILTYALLDTQSDSTFILDETAAALGIDMKPVKLNLSTMTSQCTTIDSFKITNLRVRAFESSRSDIVSINSAYTRNFIPADRSHIPVKSTVDNWQHLQEIVDELPPLQSCEVGLLIGYNCPQALAPRKLLWGDENEPYAVKTLLGWSVVGYTNEGNDESSLTGIVHRTAVKELPACSPRELISIFERDFVDDSGKCKKVSQDDITFLSLMEENITQRTDKHLEMPLPFKERPILPNNRPVAVVRLNHLRNKLKKDQRYREHYLDFMSDIIKRGDAERIESDAIDGNQWYIPHHGIYHPKKPDKLRVVFDCSARYGNFSLNEHLLKGPDLANGLTGVLCRFRRYPIAVMCDIEKMFHQFYVLENDRNFLRFLWWENGDIDSQPVDYRMCKHLFGAASSPGCANFALKYLAKQHEIDYPEASHFVQQDFYVDDGLASVETETEAVKLIHDARAVCANGGIRLHKFVSNSSNVIDSIPATERGVVMNNLNMALETISVERALGVHWNVQDDIFCFHTKIKDSEPTRRNILSIVASIFDPLGFLSPFTLKGKQILQEMCKHGVGWDDLLPSSLNSDWQNWIEDIDNIQFLQIPRCLIPKSVGKPIFTELHHFSDASTIGYGQCTYIRIIGENKIHCTLLTAKARVAPHKVVTIPRLELTAAVLSVKMSMFLKEELNLTIDKEYFWTDSKVVLGYISNEARRFHVFVSNRVQIIRNNTNPNQWFYVSTENNPADYASRGLNAMDIAKTTWLTGPSFLWQPVIESPCFETKLQLGDPEVRSEHVTTSLCTQTSSSSILERFNRFSKWSTLVSVITRIKQLSKEQIGKYSPSVEDRKITETTILKLVQRQAFSEEIVHVKSSTLPKTNRLYPLDPIFEDGLLCVGGRLRKANVSSSYKHPIILPSESHITKLILTFVHEEAKHQGRGMTLNSLRSHGYWIVGSSKVVAKFIRQCVICRRLRRPTEIQKMADLPTERVEPSPPFTYCGMDCFGPFLIKQGRKEVKRYGLLFTCMCSRAIHIEMLDDMTRDAFINGLRCFIAIRGAVRQIRCDQGSNFIGAKNEFEREKRQNQVESFLTKKQCDFILNAPHSSHTGGVWERQIRTVRNILNSVLLMCPGRLDDSSLRTIFYEVMSLVNSRPLTVSESDNLEPLSPNHILTAKSERPFPPPGEFIKEDLFLRKRWRRVQYLLEQFWARWKKEYIVEISLRQKWHEPRRNIRLNDIVLVKDVDVARQEWPIAKVVEVQTEDDGLVRRVKVQMSKRDFSAKTVVLERSVHKLVLLVEQ